MGVCGWLPERTGWPYMGHTSWDRMQRAIEIPTADLQAKLSPLQRTLPPTAPHAPPPPPLHILAGVRGGEKNARPPGGNIGTLHDLGP